MSEDNPYANVVLGGKKLKFGKKSKKKRAKPEIVTLETEPEVSKPSGADDEAADLTEAQ